MSGEKAAASAVAAVAFFVLLIGAVAAAAVSVIENAVTAPLRLTIGILHDIEHDLAGLGGSMAVPSPMITAYVDAAGTCPGLPWTILAGIGQAETSNDKNPDQVSTAGAVGPMQFLPSTFALYAYPVPPGGKNPPTPWDPVDAAYAAARLLCANGARGGKNIPAAIYAYNHASWYVAEVVNYAQLYGNATANIRLASVDTGGSGPPAGRVTGPPSAAAQTAIDFAGAQIGLPYEWGGNGPAAGDAGFDCSGLTQAAYAAAGISLPRTAAAQYAATPHVPPGQPLEPGDLVFYGDATYIHHVGMYVGNGMMIDAPHQGADVRIEPYLWTGADYYGATRPAG
jgi:hypothetical protein